LYIFAAIIITVGKLFIGTSWAGMGFVSFGLILMGIVGNAFHMSFHVRGFEYEKYKWYMELRALHYIHHLGDMKSNLAMVNLGMDGFFGSLQVDDPLRRHKDSKSLKLNRQGSQTLKKLDDMDEDELPECIDHDLIEKIKESAGFSAMTLGFDIELEIKPAKRKRATSRGYPTVLLRLLLIAISTQLWFTTEQAVEKMITQVTEPVHLYDIGHVYFTWLREYFK
jgi:hypothetical protein